MLLSTLADTSGDLTLDEAQNICQDLHHCLLQVAHRSFVELVTSTEQSWVLSTLS
jgi:hypothetical protein